MSTLENLVSKNNKKAKRKNSQTEATEAISETSKTEAISETSKTEANSVDRSQCVTLGASKEGIVVVGPRGFRTVFSTIEEAIEWLNS